MYSETNAATATPILIDVLNHTMFDSSHENINQVMNIHMTEPQEYMRPPRLIRSVKLPVYVPNEKITKIIYVDRCQHTPINYNDIWNDIIHNIKDE